MYTGQHHLAHGTGLAHEESDAPRSQDSVTGGPGGVASHASSALISDPGFFLDLGKARLLVNSSPQEPDVRPLSHAMSRCWTRHAASARTEASSASAISASISSE
jgi:hypothetical protein